MYKNLQPLKLGLGLKLGAIYSKEDLERRCKGSKMKITLLQNALADPEMFHDMGAGTESIQETAAIARHTSTEIPAVAARDAALVFHQDSAEAPAAAARHDVLTCVEAPYGSLAWKLVCRESCNSRFSLLFEDVVHTVYVSVGFDSTSLSEGDAAWCCRLCFLRLHEGKGPVWIHQYRRLLEEAMKESSARPVLEVADGRCFPKKADILEHLDAQRFVRFEDHADGPLYSGVVRQRVLDPEVTPEEERCANIRLQVTVAEAQNSNCLAEHLCIVCIQKLLSGEAKSSVEDYKQRALAALYHQRESHGQEPANKKPRLASRGLAEMTDV